MAENREPTAGKVRVSVLRFRVFAIRRFAAVSVLNIRLHSRRWRSAILISIEDLNCVARNKMTEDFVEVTAPTNIAIIKYWGKRCRKLNLPLNSSLSATLSQVRDNVTVFMEYPVYLTFVRAGTPKNHYQSGDVASIY